MKPLVKAYLGYFFFPELVKLKSFKFFFFFFSFSGITGLNITKKDKIAHVFTLNEK